MTGSSCEEMPASQLSRWHSGEFALQHHVDVMCAFRRSDRTIEFEGLAAPDYIQALGGVFR